MANAAERIPVDKTYKIYIDGSSTNPCPLDIVQDQADHVIAIDVSGGSRGVPGERPSKIDVMYANSQIMQQSIVRVMSRQFPNTALMRPEVDSFRSLDFLKTSEILDVTAPLREQIKRELDRIVTAEG